MKIVYMGTPEFAVAPLKAILEAGHEVCCVVTQPDRPKGRGSRVQMSPVKEFAAAHEIPVFQPPKIKAAESIEKLKELGADAFVVAAFGQILSEEILRMPRFGCINIHASLLPAYRGAAPIQQVILDGEKESGVTIMQMDAGIDTGDILLQRAVPIEKAETDISLGVKLSEVGATLILDALAGLEEGTLSACRQKEEESSYAKMLTKAMGLVDFAVPADVIERKVRGLYSWPGAYTFYQGKMLKIYRADVLEEAPDGEAGSVSDVTKDAIIVNTGKGKLALLEVQPEGKRRMAVRDFLAGNQIGKGQKLG